MSTGQFDIAIQRFLAAQEAFPHPSTLYNIGKAYADSGDLPNALTYFRQFREADPAHASFIDPVIVNIEQRLGTSAPSGGGGASGRAVATGEEAARFDAIVSELRALTDALEARSAELVPSAEEPVATSEPLESIGGDPSAEEAALFQDAYKRVVVTASRVGQEPLDSPSTVTIITSDDIRLSGALDVPDLFRRVVGVETMSPSAGQSEVAIRGLPRKFNNMVLFLVDGRSVAFDFIGATFWGTVPLQLEEIERIEVIRGPGAAVYGANAVTGVINVITKTPGEGQSELSATAGTLGVGRFAAFTTGRVGTSSYRLSGGYQQHGAWSKDAVIGPVGSSPIVTSAENDDLALQAIRLNARADRPIGEWGAASISAGLSQSTIELISFGVLTNQIWEFQHQYARGDLFAGDIHVRSFWSNVTGNVSEAVQYQGERPTLNTTYDSDIIDLELELPISAATGAVQHQFTIGGGWRYKGMKFGYYAGGADELYTENHFSAFANEQATVGKFAVVASARVDLHPLIEVEQTISPRAALLWRLFDKTSFRLTGGTAFRAPIPGESYAGVAIPTSADAVYVNTIPNYDLIPERITTYEFGVHDESTFFHQADLVLFYNHLAHLLYVDSIQPVIQPYNPDVEGFPVGNNPFVNLDALSNTFGVEGDLELYPVDGIDLFVNGSVSRAVDTDPSGETTVDLSSSAVKLNVGGSYRSPYRIDLSAWLNWMSAQDWPIRTVDPATLSVAVVKQPLPGRTMLTARLAVRPFSEDDIELALTAWNLTELFGDGFREYPQGQLTVGRLYGTVSWRF